MRSDRSAPFWCSSRSRLFSALETGWLDLWDSAIASSRASTSSLLPLSCTSCAQCPAQQQVPSSMLLLSLAKTSPHHKDVSIPDAEDT